MPTLLGSFTDPDALVELLRARQVELGLSNEALERICGWTGGIVDKYLGPSRVKTPGATTLAILMDALAVNGVLMADDAKAARMQRAWDREGRRRERAVRPAARIAKAALARARPLVMAELARKGAVKRWAGATPEQRAAAVDKMNAARLSKRRAGTSQ
jgi:hypothetical protein